MNAVTEEIAKLMATVKEFKVAGVDPKARNKVYARLEEAWLWSQHMVALNAPSFPVGEGGPTPNIAGCTCPHGARLKSCPIHGVM